MSSLPVPAYRSNGTSPGELKPVFEPNTNQHSPGEVSTRPSEPRSHLDTAANIQVVKQAASPDNTESRSLHTSDLHQKQRQITETKKSLSNGENVTRNQNDEEPKSDNQGNIPIAAKTENVQGIGKEVGQPPSRPPPIHVPIPLMDDSSLNTEERPGDEQEDTYGDVSSISGGDF